MTVKTDWNVREAFRYTGCLTADRVAQDPLLPAKVAGMETLLAMKWASDRQKEGGRQVYVPRTDQLISAMEKRDQLARQRDASVFDALEGARTIVDLAGDTSLTDGAVYECIRRLRAAGKVVVSGRNPAGRFLFARAGSPEAVDFADAEARRTKPKAKHMPIGDSKQRVADIKARRVAVRALLDAGNAPSTIARILKVTRRVLNNDMASLEREGTDE